MVFQERRNYYNPQLHLFPIPRSLSRIISWGPTLYVRLLFLCPFLSEIIFLKGSTSILLTRSLNPHFCLFHLIRIPFSVCMESEWYKRMKTRFREKSPTSHPIYLLPLDPYPSIVCTLRRNRDEFGLRKVAVVTLKSGTKIRNYKSKFYTIDGRVKNRRDVHIV